MTKHKKSNTNIPLEIVYTTAIAAILSGVAYLFIAFVWSNVDQFDTTAQINSALISGVVFGVMFGYKIRDLSIR